MTGRRLARLATLGTAFCLLVFGFAPPSFAFVGTPGGLGLSVDSGQTLSRQAPVYAGGGATHDVSMAVDGTPIAATPTDSPPALVTFEGSGIQSGSQNLQNSLWVNGRMVTLIKQDYSNFATATVPVPAGFLKPGTNVVRVRSGDGVSPTDLVGNHDDFSIRNLRLVLPDTDALTDPAIPPTQVIGLGDGFPGGNATESEVVADFSIDATADQLDGVAGSWDTTSVTDGPHTITATGARADGSTTSVSAQVVVDNGPPQISITSPEAGKNYEGVDLSVTAQAVDSTSQVASVRGRLDGTAIPVPDTFPSDNIKPGAHTLTVTAVDSAGNSATTTRTFTTSVGATPASFRGQVGRTPYAGPDGPTMVVAGDIACSPGSTPSPTGCQQAGTADMVATLHPDAVASLGDEQYDVGTIGNFNGSYDQTWGKFKDITYPLIGNHEYAQDNFPGAQAPGYFDYFNGVGNADGRAGDRNRGYYSYDLGSWHVVVLNAECGVVSCATGSGQQSWLAHDLATHQNYCTMAMWHQPLFTAGTTFDDGNGLATKPLWDTLYADGADLVLNGHDHNYQRYTPQNPDGKADPQHGISEFVVGTGGESHFPLSNVDKVTNLAAASDTTFGVLQLHLAPAGYTWDFLPEPGHGNGTFTDSGTASCHAPPAPRS
ncbi:MAG: metallophosphoesterase [Streptosporangiales bacterium]|nr:metallophosphoesterase [Streptosporangiales bacterium]MBO0892592.1 metallophosphoesterase [Acidothermales bacterium]